MAAHNTIQLDLDANHEEHQASAALKPGHLIEVLSNGKVRKHAVLGGTVLTKRFAKEDAWQGRTVDDAYSADEVVFNFVPTPDGRVMARLAAGAVAVVKGDKLVSNGDGCLRKLTAPLVPYSQIVESAEHENTTTDADFDKYVDIPANMLQVGDVVKIRAQATVIDNNSTDTLTLVLKVGGVSVISTGAVDVADGDVGYFDVELVVRAIGAGGVAAFQATGVHALGVPGTVTAKPFTKAQTTVFDTTAAVRVAVNADWSVAHADNEVSLSFLSVEVQRAAGPMTIVAEADEAVDNSAGGSEAFIRVRAAG